MKTDRRDAELLARLLSAGSLTPIRVPGSEVEAARELTRRHDTCRRDLMTARQRVSKMLLVHGLVYPKDNTWTQEHRAWLSRQRLGEPISDLVFADLLAAVDGLTARKQTIATRISELATDPAWWPTVARLRAFRGIDTLTAFTIHLELGADWARFPRAKAVPSWLGLTPSLHQSGESSGPVRSRRPDRHSLAGCWSSPPGTTPASRGSAPRSATGSSGSPTTSCRSPTAANNACTKSTSGCVTAANRGT